MTSLIDLGHPFRSSPDDLATLRGYPAQLVGEPFQFARVSYGDELTLHFGDLQPGRSPRMRQTLYGAYLLGMQASPWLLKSGIEPVVLVGGMTGESSPEIEGEPISREAFESRRFIEPGSMVLAATPFLARPVNGYGLQLRLSDGATIFVRPAAPTASETPEAPGLADWELITPQGLLTVGPGRYWSFDPEGV